MKTIRETPPPPTCWAQVVDSDGATVIGQVLGTPACGGYWLAQDTSGATISAHRTQRAARAAVLEAWIAAEREREVANWRARVAKARVLVEAAA